MVAKPQHRKGEFGKPSNTKEQWGLGDGSCHSSSSTGVAKPGNSSLLLLPSWNHNLLGAPLGFT